MGGTLELQGRFHGVGIFTGTFQHADSRHHHLGIHLVSGLAFVDQVVRVRVDLVANLLALDRITLDGTVLIELTAVSPFEYPASRRGVDTFEPCNRIQGSVHLRAIGEPRRGQAD